MKKLLLIAIVSISFTADKWEYMYGTHMEKHTIKIGDTIREVNGDFFQATFVTLNNDTLNYYVDDEVREKLNFGGKNITLGFNLMGADGWELIFKEGEFTYWFKRRIE